MISWIAAHTLVYVCRNSYSTAVSSPHNPWSEIVTLDGLSYSPPSLFCQSTKTRRIGTDDFKSCAASICPCEPSRSLLGRVLLQCWVSSDIFDCSNYATWNNVHLYFILYYFWTLTIPPPPLYSSFCCLFLCEPYNWFLFLNPAGALFPVFGAVPVLSWTDASSVHILCSTSTWSQTSTNFLSYHINFFPSFLQYTLWFVHMYG